MRSDIRIAFCGASGTGKTTLAQFLCDKLGLPLNPIGSRSVAQEMGYDSPYDVDKAGRRGEFQVRLLAAKRQWEDAQSSFVTDRTTFDNLTYTVMHDIATVDDAIVTSAISGLDRYTHIVYCPVSAFISTASDPARVHSRVYHELYDTILRGLFLQYRHMDLDTTLPASYYKKPPIGCPQQTMCLYSGDMNTRQREAEHFALRSWS